MYRYSKEHGAAAVAVAVAAPDLAIAVHAPRATQRPVKIAALAGSGRPSERTHVEQCLLASHMRERKARLRNTMVDEHSAAALSSVVSVLGSTVVRQHAVVSTSKVINDKTFHPYP